MKKESIGVQSHVSYLYFHKNNFMMASDFIDFDLLGRIIAEGGGGGGAFWSNSHALYLMTQKRILLSH